MTPETAPPLPPLATLGRDLLAVPRWRVAASLALPFALFAGYWAFAAGGWWVPAVGCVVALSFVTYGSISHDLVHRSLGLPRWWNDTFLTAVELLLLRSGRAYRLAHLNHHARYPHTDDPEGRAAHGSAVSALLCGPTYFICLWVWAVGVHPAHRPRLVAEAVVVLAFVAAAIAACPVTVVPLVYVALAHLGGWVVPFTTAYLPHTPHGDSPLTQTRRFRGLVARLVALDHLYHLEHHLYPAVPHHRWPELARRLDPHLDRAGVPRVSLGGWS